MLYLPVSLLLFLLLVIVLSVLWFSLALDVVQIAAAKLGFSSGIAAWLFAAIIFGSTINIPLYRVQSNIQPSNDVTAFWMQQYWGLPLHRTQQKTTVALNVGGGLIPVVLALYQFSRVPPLPILIVTAIVTVVSYYGSRIVPGIGIQMNPLLAPLTAALAAIALSQGISAAPIAFAGGVLGTLIGADLLHLKEIESMTAGVLSIGGAGVFDGIALCGLFALLLS
jgi:uncharacterized membrane protein